MKTPAIAAKAAHARLGLIVKSLREIMPRVHELIDRDEVLNTFDIAKLFDEVTVGAVHGR